MTPDTVHSVREIPHCGISQPHISPTNPGEERSVLEQLLHALNQPLTGLQCSMEVALAAPRSPEHYVRTLREGIELAGRLRALVGAIREVVAGKELVLAKTIGGPDKRDGVDAAETFELTPIVDAAIDELAPVAEAAGIRIVRDFSSPTPAWVRSRRATLSAAIFRLLESGVSLAQPGSTVEVEIGRQSAEIAMRIRWTSVQSGSLSLAELGVLVAQAGLEQAGARLQRHRVENSQTITIRLPLSASESS